MKERRERGGKQRRGRKYVRESGRARKMDRER